MRHGTTTATRSQGTGEFQKTIFVHLDLYYNKYSLSQYVTLLGFTVTALRGAVRY